MGHAEIVVKRSKKTGRVKSLRCPWCDSRAISEVDSTILWNRLEVREDGSLVAILGDEGDWEGDGFICEDCMKRLTMPVDGPDIEAWL